MPTEQSARALRVALVLSTLAGVAAAQVVNPADKQRGRADETDATAPAFGELRSWELPPTVVQPDGGSGLREEDRIGPYGQPRWTARRLFPTTRVYVVTPGQLEFEHWTRVKVPDEGPTTVENQYEVEFGLPHRLQLDLYAVTEKTGSQGELGWSEQKYELRWALADWGQLWMNPTTYVEYVSRNGKDDKLELKLLLGDELAPGWHFGSNLVLEHELGGELENEYGVTLGLARTVIDEQLSIGAEVKAALIDVHGDRGDYTEELEVGPSLQWRPLPQMHVDFAPLVGIGSDSRAADIFLVIGWEV